MTKRAICIGINDYPGSGNDLSGCINDAQAWAGLLRSRYRFDHVNEMTDSQATRRNILDAVDRLLRDSRSGDVAVLTYSGHGTWVPDRGESDESVDNRDEALYVYDGLLLDDELRAAVRGTPAGVMFTLIIDACHTGTITRQLLMRAARVDDSLADYPVRVRYMPPPEDYTAGERGLSVDLPVRQRFGYPESGMSEVLLTGCNATELSYETMINGRQHGVMTANAIRILNNQPDQSYLDLHRALRQVLPGRNFPQSPQLEGKDDNKRLKVFDNPGATPTSGGGPNNGGSAPGASGASGASAEEILGPIIDALKNVLDRARRSGL
jgi:hypothetical protein